MPRRPRVAARSVTPSERRQRRDVWSIVALSLALAGVPAVAWAEDGYDLWLRYAPIESAPLRDAYRQAIAGVVVQQSPGDGDDRLEGAGARPQGAARRRGAGVDVGRPATARWSSAPPRRRSSSALGWDDVLKGLGPGRLRHPPRAGRRQARARRRLRRRQRRALRHVPPAAAAVDRRRRSRGSTSREKPRHQLRLLNHWDNLDGSIERGYAGRSLWKWDELPGARSIRACTTTRAPTRRSASTARCINNVNANAAVAHRRRTSPRRRRIADAFRPVRAEGLPVGQLRRAAARSAGWRPPIRSTRPCSGGGRTRPTEIYTAHSRLRRLPGQGQQRGPARARRTTSAPTPTAPTCSPTPSSRTAAS